MSPIAPVDGRVAVIQPLPGIGDMAWHVPFLHALADTVADRRLTIFTKRRSQAHKLLAADPHIEKVLWLDEPNGESGPRNGSLRQLIATLRRERFRRIYVLHHSWRYAFAAWAAGVPERYGYGFGLQRLFLNGGPFLPSGLRRRSAMERGAAFLKAGRVPLNIAESRLPVAAAARAEIAARFRSCPKPWIALSVGSSEAYKQWGADRFAELARQLLAQGWPTIILLGGPADASMAGPIQALAGDLRERVIPVFDLELDRTAALLADCDRCVGNDTGVLNIAAAVGTSAIGLFGATQPLTFSQWTHAVMPPDGRLSREDGMARITIDAVIQALAQVKPAPKPLLS